MHCGSILSSTALDLASLKLSFGIPAIHGKDVLFACLLVGETRCVCILVPLAMSNKAVGIVVSPIVSLMDQQVSVPLLKQVPALLRMTDKTA